MVEDELLHMAAAGVRTEAEAEHVEDALRRHPYFPLLHYLKARFAPTRNNIFFASAYSVNRPLLKNYLRGHLFWVEPELKQPMEEVLPPDSKSPGSMTGFAPFVVLEFPAAAKSPEPEGHFALSLLPEPLPGYALLNMLTAEKMVRYRGVGEKLRTEISHYASGVPLAVPSPSALRKGRQARAQSLIDQFLQEPRIRQSAPDPALMQGEHRLAKASLEPDEEIATETLARLHLRQNNVGEALRIYQKLRLLFPEKMEYFDARIKKISES
ncbi:MAG: hypothetical protein EAZ89_18070 [Bacteroidetes bacterium]|nr:MAG: hypothetical protein EAZ89_18070 [Bacteroidota bacterium]